MALWFLLFHPVVDNRAKLAGSRIDHQILDLKDAGLSENPVFFMSQTFVGR
jgi:hypothetical protein